MGKDVVSFLSWAAEPEMEVRKLVSFFVRYGSIFKWLFSISRRLQEGCQQLIVWNMV